MHIRALFGWVRRVTEGSRASRRRMANEDPWQRLDVEPPLRAFGPGAIDEFTSFLECHSHVRVESPRDVAQWLLGCRYADDQQLLDADDVWQHPCTFELLRCGDCEDYSLWAWRQLVRAGYDAEFVVGILHRRDGVSGRHAWVVFRDGDRAYVLDGVERTAELMIRELESVRSVYEPQVGVTRRGDRFVFAGLLRTEWGERVVAAARRS